jgi:hypothetical protein
MIVLSNLQHLRPYGIDALTGEADALSYRILCDLTEKGKALICRTFGLVDVKFEENWNPGRANDPNVAAIMLPIEVFAPLAVFALLGAGFTEVYITKNDSVFAFEPDDVETEAYLKMVEIRRKVVSPTQRPGVTVGDRNVHQMSGRIA